jgi:hypothetical protein
MGRSAERWCDPQWVDPSGICFKGLGFKAPGFKAPGFKSAGLQIGWASNRLGFKAAGQDVGWARRRLGETSAGRVFDRPAIALVHAASPRAAIHAASGGGHGCPGGCFAKAGYRCEPFPDQVDRSDRPALPVTRLSTSAWSGFIRKEDAAGDPGASKLL